MIVNEPYMTIEEKNYINYFIEKLKPKKVLEYGIGWSTVHFSKHDFIELYDGIEHNQEWIDKISPFVNLEKVHLYHCPLKKDGLPPRDHSLVKNYVENNKAPYDFIFIDGDLRHQCIKYAVENLSEKGFCMVHDTARKDIHQFFKLFKHHKILTPGEFNSHNEWHQGLTILYNFEGEV